MPVKGRMAGGLGLDFRSPSRASPLPQGTVLLANPRSLWERACPRWRHEIQHFNQLIPTHCPTHTVRLLVLVVSPPAAASPCTSTLSVVWQSCIAGSAVLASHLRFCSACQSAAAFLRWVSAFIMQLAKVSVPWV